MQTLLSSSTQDPTEWFVENLPSTHLDFPDYYIYQTLLEVEDLEDIKETRGQFKKLITEKRIEKNIPLPATPDKEMEQFLNDPECKLERSRELLALTSKYLSEGKALVEAQRLALEQIFHREAPLHQAEMDESYFANRELVEADLRKFLEQAEGDSLINMNTKNPPQNICITASNGEIIMWSTYLARASIGFFGIKNNKPYRKADALNHLLKLCGTHRMNKEYFNNLQFIKHDLNAFLKQAKGDHLINLSSVNPPFGTSITVSNGERIAWGTYLNRASAVFFETRQGSDNPHRTSDTLTHLLKLCGVFPMDKKYFSNPKFIRHDLEVCLVYAKGVLLTDLSTRNISKGTLITFSNNETITWPTYLNRASAVFFETRQGSDNPHRTSDTLTHLLKLCGVFPMDKKYFSNPKFIRHDLETFSIYAKVDALIDMNTKNPPQNTSVLISNGERITWGTYLRRASDILFNTRYRTSDVLDYLIKLCGAHKMDKEYFCNSAFVQKDLKAFLIQSRVNSLNALTPSTPPSMTKIIASNGERITWATYLNRTSTALFGTKSNSKENPHRQSDALKRLKEIAAQVEDKPEHNDR